MGDMKDEFAMFAASELQLSILLCLEDRLSDKDFNPKKITWGWSQSLIGIKTASVASEPFFPGMSWNTTLVFLLYLLQ